MICQSCGNNTADHAVKSSLFTNMQLVLCDDCIKHKYEPRWVVVLYGHTYGINAIAAVLRSKGYLGKEITAAELV